MHDQEKHLPTVLGILETSLYVEDMQRSAQFYQTIFGFSIVEAVERLIVLKAGEHQLLLLFRKGASANLPKAAHDAAGESHIAFAVPSEEFSRWKEHLRNHGVEIEEERTWEFGGTSLYFRDPDDHLVELATPGTWPVY